MRKINQKHRASVAEYVHQGRNQLFILGEGNFHEISFDDDVIVLIQPWNNFFANGHI